MFTVQFKNKEIVEVPLEQLEEFLEKKRNRIEVHQKIMGQRAVTLSSQ